MYAGRRRRGRPSIREGEASTPITVRLPLSQYDRVTRIAKSNREGFTDTVRRAIAQMVVLDATQRVPGTERDRVLWGGPSLPVVHFLDREIGAFLQEMRQW